LKYTEAHWKTLEKNWKFSKRQAIEKWYNKKKDRERNCSNFRRHKIKIDNRNSEEKKKRRNAHFGIESVCFQGTPLLFDFGKNTDVKQSRKREKKHIVLLTPTYRKKNSDLKKKKRKSLGKKCHANSRVL